MARESATRTLMAHARALVGVELAELADALGLPVPAGAVRTKGWSGQILEHELGVATGGARPRLRGAGRSSSRPCPSTPTLAPRESTAVCQIDPIAIAAESWETSYVRAEAGRGCCSSRWRSPVAAAQFGRRSPRGGRAALVADARRGARRCAPTSSCSCAATSAAGAPTSITGHLGAVLQVRPKGRNAADLRAGYDAQGRATRSRQVRLLPAPGLRRAILSRGVTRNRTYR